MKSSIATPRARAELGLYHLGDRARLVTDRRDQGRHVVHRADEDHAECDPEQRGEPAEELAREDRTHDRACGGDRREVLPEQVCARRRDEVDAVLVATGGRGRA
jgi:hypothetical protein